MTGKLPGVILYHRIPKIAQALIRRSSVSYVCYHFLLLPIRLWHFHPVQTTLLLNSTALYDASTCIPLAYDFRLER